MDVKFPGQQDEFPRTMVTFVICVAAALAIGLFLGNGLGALFGTDESVITTSTYTDRMSAIRTVFTDGDQLDSFARTALQFHEMEGLTLLTSRDGDHVMVLEGGLRGGGLEQFDEEIQKSLIELMNTRDALYGVEDSAGHPIEDVRLWNIAVRDGVVYYYLYYDEAGFAGVAYDPGGAVLQDSDGALPLTRTEAGVYEWFLTYDMGDA